MGFQSAVLKRLSSERYFAKDSLACLVAKRLNSLYESGRRSGAWVKFKITKSQEFAVGGYTLPE
jgi:bifunctional non-homologous end joining protein LigD